MKQNHLDWVDFCKVTRNNAYTLAGEIREQMRVDRNLQNLADAAFALRECIDYLEETTKELKRAQEDLTKVICVHWMVSPEHMDGQPIRTDYCTVSPSSKLAPVIPHPKREPEQYHTLLAHFGVHESVIWADVLRPHWPGVVDYVSNIESAGLPAPPGINVRSERPIYGLTIRGKQKEVQSHD